MGITQEQALRYFESDDLLDLGMAAMEVRRAKTDPRVATYQIDRNINYTHFCTEYCSFCAFYRPMGSKDGYVLPFEEICNKIDEMLTMGGTGILLQGGLKYLLNIYRGKVVESVVRSLRTIIHNYCRPTGDDTGPGHEFVDRESRAAVESFGL